MENFLRFVLLRKNSRENARKHEKSEKRNATFDSAEQTERKLLEFSQLHLAVILEMPPRQETATNVFGLHSGLQRKWLHLENLGVQTLPVGSDKVDLLHAGGRDDGVVDEAEAVEFGSKVILFGLRDEDEASVLHTSFFRCRHEELVGIEGLLEQILPLLEAWEAFPNPILGPRRGKVLELEVFDRRVHDRAFGPGKKGEKMHMSCESCKISTVRT